MRRLTAVLAFLLLAAGCGGGTTVMIPPQLALAPYQPLGLITFTTENARGALGTVATDRFRNAIFAAQSGVQVLELGDQDSLLASVGRARLDPETVRAIGEDKDVSAVFAGHLVVSDVKPRARLGPNPGLAADVTVTLTVRLFSTERGATIWSASGQATETIAGLAVVGGTPVFGAQDPDEAYGHLIGVLVGRVTRDLRPTYERR
jgi:hypothetical protein